MIKILSDPSQRGQYLLLTEQWLPAPREEVFHLFADAFELENLTPPWLKFKVLTPAPIRMKQGALIDYSLKLHGIPVMWQTEITSWEPGVRFVDEQIRGPYKRWWHEHTFTDHNGGTLVRDQVQYAVLGGFLLQRLFIKRDLRAIFTYRHQKMEERFASDNPDSSRNAPEKN